MTCQDIISLRFNNDSQFPLVLGIGHLMRFVLALFAACCLLLTVSTGAAAGSSVSFEPSPTEVAVEHHEGDGDQVPDCPVNSGTHHHHSSCSAHQLAATDALAMLTSAWSNERMLAMTQELLPPGLRPSFEPHPPKA